MSEYKTYKNDKEIYNCLAHISNLGNCDYCAMTGFSIQSLGVNGEIENIISMINSSEREEIYLVLENLNILGHRNFYNCIENKKIYITTNDYSNIIDTLITESGYNNGLIKVSGTNSNQSGNDVKLINITLSIPELLIQHLEKQTLDSLSFLLKLLEYGRNNTVNGKCININITMLHHSNIFKQLFSGMQEHKKDKELSNQTIDKLCVELTKYIHKFYEEYKHVLSYNNILFGDKYINSLNDKDVNIRKNIIEEYIQNKIKPQLIEIQQYINGYTKENTSFLVWSLCLALIFFPISIISSGIGAGIIATSLGVTSMWSAVIGITCSYLSISYSLYNFIATSNNMANNQKVLHKLYNNLYFVKLLNHFYSIISPLIEYEFSIRGNYLYDNNVFYIYNSTYDMPNYLKKYYIRFNDKDNKQLVKFLKNFDITDKQEKRDLRETSEEYFEVYKSDEKVNIFSSAYLKSQSIVYIETPLCTTPFLISIFRTMVENNNHHRNIICFSNSLNTSQSAFVKNELYEKLSIMPSYISYNHGAEDKIRNYFMHDYSFYDIVMAANSDKTENTSKIMFFSLFHYQNYTYFNGLISQQIDSLKKHRDEFLKFVYNDMCQYYPNNNLDQIFEELLLYFSPIDTLDVVNKEENPYLNISNIIKYLNDFILYLDRLKSLCNMANDKEDSYGACIQDIGKLFSLIGDYQISVFNNNKLYKTYRNFIMENIDSYLDKEKMPFNKHYLAYELSRAHLLTQYNIYDDMDVLIKKYRKTTYHNIFNNLLKQVSNNILSNISECNNIYKTIMEQAITIYLYMLSSSIYLNNKILENIFTRYGNIDMTEMYSKIIGYYFTGSVYHFYKTCYSDIEQYGVMVILEDIYYILENEMRKLDNLVKTLNINDNDLQNKFIPTLLVNIENYYQSLYYDITSKGFPSSTFNRYCSKDCSMLIKFYNIHKEIIDKNNNKYNVHSSVVGHNYMNVNITTNNAQPLSYRDYIVTISLLSYDINTVANNLISVFDSQSKLLLRNFAGITTTGLNVVSNYILIKFYNIPDDKKLKKYIELYNYIYLNQNVLQPHTIIKNNVVCKPIYIHNNMSVIDNHHILFGDKNMDINFLKNSYSLYANLKRNNISIFRDRMYTILTGVGIEGLDNVLLHKKEKEYKFIKYTLGFSKIPKNEIKKKISDLHKYSKYNFLQSGKDINNFIKKYFILLEDTYEVKEHVKDFIENYCVVGADRAWKYIIEMYEQQKRKNSTTLNINIDILKLMLGLDDEKDNFNSFKHYQQESEDTPATTVAKSFYHVVSFITGNRIDTSLIPVKVYEEALSLKTTSEVQSQTQDNNKRKYTFTDSLHEIARQNLYSAYITDDYMEKASDKGIIRNRQPFIGIITLWVLPKNLVEVR